MDELDKLAALTMQTWSRIEKNGFTMIGILASEDTEPWIYTAGMSSHGLAEVVIHGLPPHVTTDYVSGICTASIESGEDLTPGRLEDFMNGPPGVRWDAWVVEVIDVDDPEHPLSMAREFAEFGGWDLRAIQIAWPDRFGRFPWEEGSAVRDLQILRGVPVL